MAGGQTPKGYMLKQFKDTFDRYLFSPDKPATTPQDPFCGDSAVADSLQSRTTETQSATQKSSFYGGCGGVADNSSKDDENIIEVSEDILTKAGWIQ